MVRDMDSYIGSRPALFIEEELESRSWSVEDLAQGAGIKICEINDVLSGNKVITFEMAKALGKGFGIDGEVFTHLQNSYDHSLEDVQEITSFSDLEEEIILKVVKNDLNV